VELAVARLERVEKLGDLLVVRDVALERLGAREGPDEVFGFLAQALVLIGDGQLGAGFLKPLRDRPGDGALVGDAEDDGRAVFHELRHRYILVRPDRITGRWLRGESWRTFVDSSSAL